MFKKEQWQTDVIVATMSRLVKEAHGVLCIAMLGAIMAVVGFCKGAVQIEAYLKSVPENVLVCALGGFVFFAFFPWPYLIYLARELQVTKDRVEALEKKVAANADPGSKAS